MSQPYHVETAEKRAAREKSKLIKEFRAEQVTAEAKELAANAAVAAVVEKKRQRQQKIKQQHAKLNDL